MQDDNDDNEDLDHNAGVDEHEDDVTESIVEAASPALATMSTVR